MSNRRLSSSTRARIEKDLEKRLSQSTGVPQGLDLAKPTFDLTGIDLAPPPPPPPEPLEETRVLKWDEAIDLDHLIELKNAFETTEKRNEGCFEMDEFIQTFGWVLGKGKSEEELSLLFMKIDANSDGTVDWDEFVSFLLSENANGLALGDDKHAKHYLTSDLADINHISAYHREDISCVVPLRMEKLGSRGDRYVTASRDGTIRVWYSSNLKHKATIQTWSVWGESQNILGSSPSWITDICFMPMQQKIVVSSMDRSLSFYDAIELKPLYRIREFDNAPLTLHYYEHATESIIVFGDDKGQIQFARAPKGSDFERVMFQKFKIHNDWVTKVQYIPDLGMFLSASLDGSMKVTDLDGRLQRSLEGHPKGVHNFDWSAGLKCIASCGLDKTIRLWNPYISKPMVSLLGHVATVLKVVFNNSLSQLISLSADKQIKVWDVQTYRCIQTIDYKASNWVEDRLGVLIFDEVNEWILIGGTRLSVLPHHQTKNQQIRSHDNIVMCAIYNNAFHQVVSCDDYGVVRVWDLDTGTKIFEYGDTHQGKLNSACYDITSRRLLTGGSDGFIRVWNFNNGQVLSDFDTKEPIDIAQVFHVPEGNTNRSIVSVGSNRKVVIWREIEDDNGDEYRRQFNTHSDDVICADFVVPNYLATGCCDGSIGIWNLESGYLRHMLIPPCISGSKNVDFSADKIMFLPKKDTLLLVASYSDGYLRLWNIKDGALLREENPKLSKEHSILAMTSDQENRFLYIADAMGYIKSWDISQMTSKNLQTGYQLNPLALWKGHSQSILNLDFVNRHSMVLSSSVDGTIKLWKSEGTLIGIFGQPNSWKTSNPLTYSVMRTIFLDVNKSPYEKDVLPKENDMNSDMPAIAEVPLRLGTPEYLEELREQAHQSESARSKLDSIPSRRLKIMEIQDIPTEPPRPRRIKGTPPIQVEGIGSFYLPTDRSTRLVKRLDLSQLEDESLHSPGRTKGGGVVDGESSSFRGRRQRKLSSMETPPRMTAADTSSTIPKLPPVAGSLSARSTNQPNTVRGSRPISHPHNQTPREIISSARSNSQDSPRKAVVYLTPRMIEETTAKAAAIMSKIEAIGKHREDSSPSELSSGRVSRTHGLNRNFRGRASSIFQTTLEGQTPSTQKGVSLFAPLHETTSARRASTIRFLSPADAFAGVEKK